MISIIVPVYKVEKYVSDCIKSILRQEYNDYEVIIIDDGSPDQSISIIRKEIKNAPNVNVQIISTNNKGVSAARNLGIRKAKGDYVVMIDSDDSISPYFLKDFADLINKNPDTNIFSCGFKVVGEKTKIESSRRAPRIDCFDWKEAQNVFLQRKIRFLLPALLFKRDFLINNRIEFDEEVRYSEDVQFIWRALAYNRSSVLHMFITNYYYYLHEGSTMTASNLGKIKTFYGGITRLFNETEKYYCESVKEMILPKSYFASLHSASKLLSYEDFLDLYNYSNAREYLKLLARKDAFTVRTVSSCMLLSNRLGYLIMRSF